MDIPYGFDCYTFASNEIKYFDHSAVRAQSAGRPQLVEACNSTGPRRRLNAHQVLGCLRFTRKNEDYTQEQVEALLRGGRLNASELAGRKMFCGIKLQIGVAVLNNFVRAAMQYKKPIRGRSELVNGSWGGIVSGLTGQANASSAYDVAIGNFLAYDEEFPYIKFGPFFAIESKLVMLTGSARSTEASAFGTNVQAGVYLLVLGLMLLLALLSGVRVGWRRRWNQQRLSLPVDEASSLANLVSQFFFIYVTMLLNKPSIEFDDFIWPRAAQPPAEVRLPPPPPPPPPPAAAEAPKKLARGHREPFKLPVKPRRSLQRRRKQLPGSLRALSYIWSAACFVMASVFSGEMLAVILLKSEQNIDTVSQLINSKPAIEPVIRQDDFTYNLMLKSLDANMLELHNKTKIIPRAQVYTSSFIEALAQRKQALLGDDELIETIYDIYHKHYPLYRSKVAYLQYPISIMYRKDLNKLQEAALRRGMVQVFETGLTQRWYQAQKDAYIQFYDNFEKKQDSAAGPQNAAEQMYKPLSMQNFESFFRLMLWFGLFAFCVLALEHLSYWRQRRLGDRAPASADTVGD